MRALLPIFVVLLFLFLAFWLPKGAWTEARDLGVPHSAFEDFHPDDDGRFVLGGGPDDEKWLFRFSDSGFSITQAPTDLQYAFGFIAAVLSYLAWQMGDQIARERYLLREELLAMMAVALFGVLGASWCLGGSTVFANLENKTVTYQKEALGMVVYSDEEPLKDFSALRWTEERRSTKGPKYIVRLELHSPDNEFVVFESESSSLAGSNSEPPQHLTSMGRYIAERLEMPEPRWVKQ